MSTTDYNPPHNEPSEMGLLGCCLLDGANVAKAFDAGIRDEAFHLSAHGVLWRRLRQMDSDQNPIDLITLTQTLRASGELEEVGGAGYLTDCTGQAPVASNFDYHAKAVLESWQLRDVWNAATTATRDSVEPGATPAEIVFKLREVLDRVATVGGAPAQSAREQTLAWLDGLEARQEARRGGRELSGIPSGFRSLDRMSSGLPLGGLSIVAARPSIGKTALACNIIRHSCLDLGTPTVLFSLETTPTRILDRLASGCCNIPAAKIRDGEELSEREHARLAEFGIKMSKGMFCVESLFDCDQICASIARHADSGKKLFLVDYLQLVNASNRPKNEPRTYALGSVSMALKQASIKHNVCVVALAQLKRPDDDSRIPTENDIADCDQLFRDADLLWLLHRPDRIEEPEKAVVVVGKCKDGECGVVPMRYIPEFFRFEEQRERPDR